MPNDNVLTFVKETPDSWIYEGLAIPYGGVTTDGQDLTGSHFTAKTDLCLDWFPEGGRPLLYRHGFDPEVKATPIGRETGAVREDDKGRWYRLQIEKAKEYAAEVKALADEGVLALSSGAVDHLTKIAAKTGEIKVWPWVELSFVPNPANPEALVYPVKSADAVEHLTIIETEIPEAIREVDPESTVPVYVQDGDGCEDAAVEAALHDVGEAHAIREGRRHSTADYDSIQAIHDAAYALGAVCAAEKEAPPAPRLVITGTAAAKDEPDLSALTEAMKVVATAKARELLRTG